MTNGIKVLHILSLDTPAGTECSFYQILVNDSAGVLEHHVLLARGPCHPDFRPGVRQHARSLHLAKYWNGLKLPRRPAFLRRRQLDKAFKSVRPDVTILYNCLGNLDVAEAAAEHSGACVYWERGSAWTSPAAEDVAAFLHRMDAVLCNSHACKRMLELRWGADSRKITVRHNPLRCDLPNQDAAPRKTGASHPLRLGIIGRMTPIKGFPLALHAAQRLVERGLPCELHVVGTGPDDAALRNLAGHLHIDKCVRFGGHVNDLTDFYRGIDILLCPSIREPFGNVCAEAAHFGLPVIGALVDGIPETVLHEKTGLCLPPTLPFEDYKALGGTVENLPEWTYDPRKDCLSKPSILDPASIADAVMALADNRDSADRLGAAAREFVATHRRFDDYLGWFHDVMGRLVKA